MKIQRFATLLLILLLTAVGCTTAPEPTSTSLPPTQPSTAVPVDNASGKTTLTIADISDAPTDIIESFQPMADYLAANLGEYGIQQGVVKVAPDIASMARLLESGEVDLYFDSPYPALFISDVSGAEPLLRRWKDGVSEYHAVIFTLASSGIETVEDLQGHMIAFDEAYSTSGYMLPMAHLVESGLNLSEKTGATASVADDEIGYLFSGDDDNSVQWVISSVVAAAAVDSATFAEIPEATRAQLRVIGETEPLPRHVLVVAPEMDPALKEAIRDLLTQMDQTEEGQAVLATFESTARIDEFPGGAEQALARMRELFDIVEAQ